MSVSEIPSDRAEQVKQRLHDIEAEAKGIAAGPGRRSCRPVGVVTDRAPLEAYNEAMAAVHSAERAIMVAQLPEDLRPWARAADPVSNEEDETSASCRTWPLSESTGCLTRE